MSSLMEKSGWSEKAKARTEHAAGRLGTEKAKSYLNTLVDKSIFYGTIMTHTKHGFVMTKLILQSCMETKFIILVKDEN